MNFWLDPTIPAKLLYLRLVLENFRYYLIFQGHALKFGNKPKLCLPVSRLELSISQFPTGVITIGNGETSGSNSATKRIILEISSNYARCPGKKVTLEFLESI